ncbi:MAG: ABC transporter ATP-binding protein [Turicibacter sp.]
MKRHQFIKEFFWLNKVTYFVGVCFMILAAYIQTLFPKVLGETIDLLGEPHFEQKDIIKNIFLIIIISILTFSATYAWRNFIIKNARLLECTLREKLFLHLQKMPVSFYQKRKTGDLIAYAINDISAVRMTFGPATAMSINGIALCIATIFSMIQKVEWRLTIICLIPIPIIVFMMLKIGTLIRLRFKKVQECFASISDRVQENIYGIRVIKSFVQEEDELKKFDALNQEMVDANLKMIQISSVLTPAIELCFSISFVLSLIIGGNMVLEGHISLGDFVAFNTYLTMLMGPVISIGRIINIFQRGMASYNRLEDIFEIESEINDALADVRTTLTGQITINDLTFTYPGAKKPSLRNINLTIEKGQKIGIVGKTGSGKTTLIQLLLKLYTIPDGMISFNEIDLNRYTLNTLRDGIGVVLQDNFLFSSSIKDNMTFFKTCYEQEAIEACAKISCIHETITQLPKGYETLLGERGINLSGGQKQRLSIARALLKNPPVLILDDALSAVDTITEGTILSHFEKFRNNQTEIIIAHKLSSVKHCDHIILLDEGMIIEEGTHEELLQKGGNYYDIYIEQSKDNQK